MESTVTFPIGATSQSGHIDLTAKGGVWRIGRWSFAEARDGGKSRIHFCVCVWGSRVAGMDELVLGVLDQFEAKRKPENFASKKSKILEQEYECSFTIATRYVRVARQSLLGLFSTKWCAGAFAVLLLPAVAQRVRREIV